MNRLLPFAFAALALVAAAPAGAQSLDALTAAEQQVAAAWDATPLTFRKTLFADRIEAFGVYEAKEGSTFAPGEPIVVYAEPVGYGYKNNDDGTYTFGFDFDLKVKNADGDIVAGKDGFASFELNSKAQNREFLVKVDDQIEKNSELQKLVGTLEERHDSYMEENALPSPLVDEDGEVPRGDEIAAELERFLAERNED